MKKFILTLLGLLIVYIGCVIWVMWGLKLNPTDKFLICVMAKGPILIAILIGYENDWFTKDN